MEAVQEKETIVQRMILKKSLRKKDKFQEKCSVSTKHAGEVADA